MTVRRHFPAAVLGFVVFAAAAAGAAAETRLTILHVNDFHARFEPINRFDSTCGAKDRAAGLCFGGAARLATAIASERRKAEAAGRHVLVLAGGDWFQGSLFYTHYKGMAAAQVTDLLGFDASAIGNHEFDDGPMTLADFIAAVDYPVVGANVIVADEPALAGKVPAFAVIERDGVRFGVIGATTEETPEISSTGPNVRIPQAEARLRIAVAQLTARGVDKIILASHLGINREIAVAKAVAGIDAIIGGHTNTLMSNTAVRADHRYPLMVAGPGGVPTPLAQAYAYGKYLGVMHLDFDDRGKVVAAAGDTLLLDHTIAEEPAMAALVARLGAPLATLAAQPVGHAAAAIDGARSSCRVRECAMGVLVTDAIAWRTRDLGTQIVIVNGGGLRASIDAGEITMGEVLAVLPFQNTIATFELTGADVVAALENGVSRVADVAGRFPQVAGLKFTWDAAQPPGSRIVEVDVRRTDGSFAALDPAARYRVASNNFMRAGGDGYTVFATNAIDAYDFGPGLEEAVADYIATHSPVAPQPEGRITAR